MLMNVRIGFSLRKFSFVNRPLGRSWIYDIGLMYMGTYSFLLSHIMGIRQVYDGRIDSLCQQMIKSNKKVESSKCMDFTSLDDWKCYLYKLDF